MENLPHLFFQCDFNQRFWWALGVEWNTDLDIYNMINDDKDKYSQDFLMEILINGCWSLWKQRNDAILRDIYILLFLDVLLDSNISSPCPYIKLGRVYASMA
jgi:hypothetical protein